MIKNHNSFMLRVLLSGLLCARIIAAFFDCANAPILRDIAKIQAQMDEAQAVADKAHQAWLQQPLSPPAPASAKEPPYTEREVELIAKTVWAEARGCSPEEQALVIWTIFQRVDDPRWPDSIEDVVTQRAQFYYRESYKLDNEIRMLVLEELEKWFRGDAPPTLAPYASASYYFFEGDNFHNYFREKF